MIRMISIINFDYKITGITYIIALMKKDLKDK